MDRELNAGVRWRRSADMAEEVARGLLGNVDLIVGFGSSEQSISRPDQSEPVPDTLVPRNYSEIVFDLFLKPVDDVIAKRNHL